MLEKNINKLMILAVVATICLPIGIVGIVLGAVNGIWALLGVGIAMTVFGFYGTPLLWVGYASLKTMKRLVEAVEEDNVYDVRTIANLLNLRVKETDAKIREALRKKYIVGYLYENGELRLNMNVKQTPETITFTCEACGARVTVDPMKKRNECPYCGTEYGSGARKYGK